MRFNYADSKGEKKNDRKTTKNQIREMEKQLKSVKVDTDFNWVLIKVDQCHPERITKIMSVCDQAVLTSSEDCSTKVWQISFADKQESGNKGIRLNTNQLGPQKYLFIVCSGLKIESGINLRIMV